MTGVRSGRKLVNGTPVRAGLRARRLALVGAAAVSVLAMAACSASNSEVSSKLKAHLNSTSYTSEGLAHADSVDCPGGVQLKNGATFSCTVQGTNTQGQSATFTVSGHVENGNTLAVTSLTEQGGASSTPATPSTTTT